MSHDTLEIRFATVNRNDRGKAKNVNWTWGRLIERLSKVEVDHDTTTKQYREASTDKRGKLKDVGAFIGGPVVDGVRKRDNMLERTLVTLDIDEANAGQISDLDFGLSDLAVYEWFAYTTRSHTAEKPKLRVVLPLTRRLTQEEYGPLSRILASKVFGTVGEAMDAVDDVSFRVAQIMYWPSRNSDGEFRTIRNEGILVDPDKVLSDFGNWRDWTQLPYSEKRGMKRPSTKKAEHPHQKRGIVGAFCRAYSVPDAIKTFLPDIYELGDEHSAKPRYTYKKGSGANGAVVEDGGLFLYSNHGTDPCGERLVNAFDLVRIHKFGDLDREAGFNEEEGQPKSAPSFKAMSEEFSGEGRVAAELVKDAVDADSMFEDFGDDMDEPAKPEKTEPSVFDEFEQDDDILAEPATEKSTNWLTLLEREKDGSIKSTLPNIAMIVRNDPRLSACVEWNSFLQRLVSRSPIRSKDSLVAKIAVSDKMNGEIWTDRHDNAVRMLIEREAGKGKKGYGFKVPENNLRAAVDAVGFEKTFHPIQDYLEGLKWDGKRRIERIFIDYLGEEDNEYTRGIGRLMFLGAVTRVYEPGHKFDYAVIIEGLQGKRKSTFIRTLAKHWFVELHGDFDDRKMMVERMQGGWILEIPELSGFTKAEVNEIKAFVSGQEDNVRLAYAHRAEIYKRQCIFIGSTNERQYLRDTTGGRRFWPVKTTVDSIDIDRLEREVDQMWAEAHAGYREMRAAKPRGDLPLYLSSEGARLIAESFQESRRVQSMEDELLGVIQAWADEPSPNGMDDEPRQVLCALQVKTECLDPMKGAFPGVTSQQINRAIDRLEGWHNGGREYVSRYGRQRVHRRIGTHRDDRRRSSSTDSDI